MQRIIYVSEAVANLPSDEVFRIIETSSRNNMGEDITGFLLFRAGKFLQLVEGPRGNLDSLLARLHQDPRHHSINILSREPVFERLFPRWRMKRLANGQDAVAALDQAMAAEVGNGSIPAEVRAFLLDSAGD
ncbi:BLUF domain-containing protein [Qipengyuania marisflavi]|uniref:BLUF domain-containing protein n=1 Tax=Qipengyuania marisflavi TaxID=2486356 RepID=A0A5S3P7J4_9SPHN|nr:BLUF domain-containing protein [Qipengyuania marisflavi]TMM48203.1 BLUF domain-containing protein [Qipengyuania marisflavi]